MRQSLPLFIIASSLIAAIVFAFIENYRLAIIFALIFMLTVSRKLRGANQNKPRSINIKQRYKEHRRQKSTDQE